MPRAPKGKPVRRDEPSRSRQTEAEAERGGRASRKVPYYEGYFGTGEEEGVERERELGGGEGEVPEGPPRRKA